MRTKNHLKIIAIALYAAMLTGCATGNKFSDMKESETASVPEKSRIFLYRPSVIGFGLQPDLKINNQVFGTSKATGYHVLDKPHGVYKISSDATPDSGVAILLGKDTRYIRLNIAPGILVGSVYPEEVNRETAMSEIMNCSKQALDPEYLKSNPQ